MTAADLYRRLVIPDRFRVMGYDLVPFTVGHALLFDRLGVEKIEGWADLMVACKLCSVSARKAERWACSPFRRWLTWTWIRWTKLHAVSNPAEVAKAIETFSAYLDVSTRAPKHEAANREGEPGKPCGSPPAQALRVTLMARLGYPPEKVDETPYLRAVWDYLTWMEQEGHVHIYQGLDDAVEVDFQKQADAFAERLKQEGFAWP